MPPRPSTIDPSATVIGIKIPAMETRHLEVILIGDSPLISHAWSEKAKQGMRDKQGMKAVQAKAPKDPEQEYRDSLYSHPELGYMFPANAFKLAAVGACRWVDGMVMTNTRGTFHIDGSDASGDLVKVHAPDGQPAMREDMVRLGGKSADLRYRGQFMPWYVRLRLHYNANGISPEQIINLLNIAGFGIGIGDWRVERNGRAGRFHAARAEELAIIETGEFPVPDYLEEELVPAGAVNNDGEVKLGSEEEKSNGS